jgi:hypothetical protein
LTHTAVQSIQVAVFLSLIDLNEEWIFKDMYICSMGIEVIILILKFSAKESFLQHGYLEREHLLIHPYKVNHRKKSNTG